MTGGHAPQHTALLSDVGISQEAELTRPQSILDQGSAAPVAGPMNTRYQESMRRRYSTPERGAVTPDYDRIDTVPEPEEEPLYEEVPDEVPEEQVPVSPSNETSEAQEPVIFDRDNLFHQSFPEPACTMACPPDDCRLPTYEEATTPPERLHLRQRTTRPPSVVAAFTHQLSPYLNWMLGTPIMAWPRGFHMVSSAYKAINPF